MNIRKFVKLFIPRGLFKKIEPLGHLAEAFLFNLINGFPARGMKVIGVTGTNGKTTTAFMIHRMLQEAGYKTGLMTTVAWGVGEDIRDQKQHYTTVPSPELMRRLKHVRAEKVDWLVMEVTSQALAQNRAWGIPYSIAVMTNVTHEHLTYHGTFERYRNAKRKLFKQTNRNPHGLQVGIINAEDLSAELFAQDIRNPLFYGIGKGDLQAEKVSLKPSGSDYVARIADESYDIHTNMPGSFNVSNTLAAVAVGRTVGLTKKQIEQGIAALQGVEGRMTRVDEGQDFDVIVDYAHTPDSYEKLFKDLKPVVKGKIIVLFGSLGGGDKGKRPLQGELAGQYADEVILTEEDDRQESPEQIVNDIAAGSHKAGKIKDKDLFMIHDRTEAITFALKRAQKGDTVLLLGKGHEKTIEGADGVRDWDEIAITQSRLRLLIDKKAK